MPQLPLVSIITPSYNHGHFIEQTIQSVLAQDYPNLEYILVDGGSNDNTIDIIHQYADQLAWWVSEKDHGQADAINKGFAHAHGEIIAWLNSDDLFYSNEAISHAVQALQARPGLGMVYADGILVDEHLNILDWHTYPQFNLTDLLGFKVLLQPTVFMREKALREAGYLPMDYDLILDQVLWIMIAAKYPILHVNEFWSVERSHSSAKTISQAAHYGEEAFLFIKSLENHPDIGEVIRRHYKSIYAGLHIFDGKRQIDAGNPRLAIKRFRQAWQLSPTSVVRAWYKVLQALGGCIGIGNWFTGYRSLRRKLKYRHNFLAVSDKGVRVSVRG